MINGVGGIGKSTLSKEFIFQNMDSFDYIGWIDYKSSLQSDFISQINESPKFQGTPDEIFNQIIGFLDNLKGKKLLVLDNFDNPSAEDKLLITKILSDFKILVTSRSTFSNLKLIPLNKLSEKDAIILFEQYCNDYEINDLKILLKRIDYHTLLIELVAKTLSESSSFDIKYIKSHFDERNLKAIEIEVDSDQNINLPIIEHIKALFDLNTISNDELLILKKFSILPSTEIEFNELKNMFGIKESLDKNLAKLSKSGWVQKNKKIYKVHQLILDFINETNPASQEEVKIFLDSLQTLFFNNFENLYKLMYKVHITQINFKDLNQLINKIDFKDLDRKIYLFEYIVLNSKFTEEKEKLKYDLKEIKTDLFFLRNIMKVFQKTFSLVDNPFKRKKLIDIIKLIFEVDNKNTKNENYHLLFRIFYRLDN